MTRTQVLWEQNRETIQGCLEHPFVQGIASGQLPREPFLFYVAQDAYFLEAFARAYSLAFAKVPDREGMQACKELLEGALQELELHKGFADRWDVDLAPEPASATQAYTDFLLRVAWSEPVGRILAAMGPCMSLYAFLGHSLKPELNPESPYREWVDTYASQEFQDLPRRLDQLLERYDDGSVQVETYYRTAMRLELAFFEQAWQVGHGA